jgi:hypothetical protein
MGVDNATWIGFHARLWGDIESEYPKTLAEIAAISLELAKADAEDAVEGAEVDRGRTVVTRR